MKKIFLTLAVASIAASSVLAQAVGTTPVDSKKLIDQAKTKIENSNKDINDAKKGGLSKTWESRGKLFLDAAKINTKSVNPGMYAAKCDQSPFINMEMLLGQPTSKKTEGEYEVWVYPTINYYIKDNQLVLWKETYVADEKALDKAAEAYRKAAELDPKGAFKSKKSTMDAVKDMRSTYFTNGLNAYQLKDYKSAAQNFESAYSLSDFPRDAKDTTIADGMIAYYGAICAYEDNSKDKAAKLFKEAANKNYQIGGCYHYLYQINMDNGKDAEALKLITTAYDKYPQEEQILYDVINYYLGKKQTSEAEKYLDKAIQKYPENTSLYTVKASMYVNEYNSLAKEYKAQLGKVDSLKKAAFRNRNNAAEEKRLTSEKDAMQAKADQTEKQYYENQKKAEAIYNQIIQKDAKYYDAYYMLGFLNYDKADFITEQKNAIPYSEDKDGSKAAAKDKLIKESLNASAANFEKASQIKPKETDVLKNLKTIYYKLGETEKWNVVKAKLDALN